ncbi:outer membrane protein assembly factor BamB family protein [Micromonospora viridifaciens]|uniref:outer membrane protein assembly factor BamB family protein n=1 Tax=Micromonospora viridifaciens TaxID=1881 RepID=UPI0012FE5BE5|nr:PQQ-binding-like beta-propeller repeat protein [Micromonospora viridifaciens]
MTVIDLGVLRDDPAPDPPTRPPRAVGRRYRCLAVLLAALVTLAGAAPAPRRIAATVPGGPGAEAYVVDDRVYVIKPPDRGVGRQLVAYRATAGRPQTLWRVPLPGDSDVVMAEAVDGRLLLFGRAASDTGLEAMGLDAATGRLGWRHPGVPFLAGDAVLLNTSDGAGAAETSRVDARTGRTLWSLPRASAELSLSHGSAGGERLVLVHDSGTVEVFDAASGARLVARDLRSGEPPGRRQTMAAGDLLLVTRGPGDPVTGYDLDRLEPRWTVSLPPIEYAEPCGRSLCAYHQANGLLVLDPATGATRWSDPRWWATLAAADGRLLVAGPVASTTAALTVVEEATGRLVADLGMWQVVPGDDEAGPLIGVRLAGGRLIIAELDLAAGHARVRAALPGARGDCRLSGALLVCRRFDGRFALWWNR